mmetsp:Transcript_21356/g.40190  ORF Transcript_21356/g.40190 Transcript_21356/m.40190 type:complete len:332 (+) Transcript_21356:39-1034(+)
MYAASALSKLGYEFRPGHRGKSDLALRQKDNLEKGFEWKDQANYDAVADAVVSYVQLQLTALCGLVPLPLPPHPGEANSVVYASNNLEAHTGPLLLLVCGSAPGGAAGVWGRSLCINSSLHEGAMFDYIFRAEALGWAVLVANPNINDCHGVPVTGSESPHQHLCTLWKSYISTAPASCVLVVAHSYGAPTMVNLLKVEPEARSRISALAFTDGMAFPPGSLLMEAVPENSKETSTLRSALLHFETLAPEAFKPASADVRSCLRVARNFKASAEPAGTPLEDVEGVLAVSAGHTSHPATTHASTEPLFAFLQLGTEAKASLANDQIRATLA